MGRGKKQPFDCTVFRGLRSLEIWPHLDEFGHCFCVDAQNSRLQLGKGRTAESDFNIFNIIFAEAHTFVLFWLFDLVMYSEAPKRSEEVRIDWWSARCPARW